MKAVELAKYVVTFFDDKGDPVTNKKLQKLLYYIEAWNLVYLKSLFSEDIEAWVYGPVVPEVYREYKKFGYSPITQKYPQSSSPSKKLKLLEKKLNICGDQKELIEAVLEKYGAMSSFQLERLTHSEIPWLEARGDCGPIDRCFTAISRKTMKEYYSSLLNVKEEKE
jgi:uncharacterized phage-associated protein